MRLRRRTSLKFHGVKSNGFISLSYILSKLHNGAKPQLKKADKNREWTRVAAKMQILFFQEDSPVLELVLVP